ncbi:hypothetical protein AVEN_248585-1 [Araneus ventricosus]|uniref:Uncharacterized protein n=1 Tax=Araneus ventricosus TaxID=182803 RepID=A0A4Y2I182_ARAVE|nr:hypothetical protein AVEN_248585-1 [Araneus ventricosus]
MTKTKISEHWNGKRIKKCRNSKKKEISREREFKVPNLNFRATEYYDCINWFSTGISEPPITKNLSSKEIERNIVSGLILEEATVCFLSHTQAVERTIKIVTEAAMKICGREGRDTFIRAKLQSRKNAEIQF